MARSKKRTPEVEHVRAYVEGVAKNLVDKLYGPNGPAPGTRLTQIEDLGLELRDLLTEKMLAAALGRQAQQQTDAVPRCPSCQQPVACQDTEERLLQTRAGAAVWSEPKGYCTRCRRAFFPSGPEPRP
jgi:hypothetical protein